MITIIICCLLFIDLICVGRNSFAAATGLTLLTFAGIWIFSHNPFLWLLDHLAIVSYCSVAYLIIGFIYSLFKYKRFLEKKRPGFAESEWGSQKAIYYSPSVMKGDIFGWIFWWPLSIVGYFISDFIYEALEKLWNSIKGAFDNIFDKA